MPDGNTWVPLTEQNASSEHDIQTPKEFLGFEPGEDRKLADWPQIADYFHMLARMSDREITEDIGKTTEGNPLLMTTISSPENLADLEKYRAIQKRLADPRTIGDDTEAERFFSGDKVIKVDSYWKSTGHN